MTPPEDVVVLGKIVGPYGLRGEVKVHPFADDPEAWGKLRHWWLGRDGEAPALWRKSRVLRCRAHGEALIVGLECLVDRTAAETAQGILVGVPRAQLPVAAKDEY